MILSILPTKLSACSTAPRVSSSHPTSRICYSLESGGGGARRRNRFSYLQFCDSNLWGKAVILDKKKSSSRRAAAAAAAAAVASGSTSDQHEISPPRTFLDAHTEQDLLLGIRKEVEAGRLPINVAQGMEELYHSYRNAVFQGGHRKADEIVLSNMAVTLDRIFLDVLDPFQFSPYHEAIREPFDYYMFGQKYVRPLLDFRTSYVGNIVFFNEIEKKLKQGENVILISNHQTEADPAVIALLLESTNPFIAENMIFVAGDRVITDPLCKPFSMGRNLLCVYSKKHMNDDPKLIDMKKRANTKSLKEMALLLRSSFLFSSNISDDDLSIALWKGKCTCTGYPIPEYLSFSNLSAKVCCFAVSLALEPNPKTYHEALQRPKWKLAMDEEMVVLLSGNTQELVPAPPDVDCCL